MDLQNLKNIQVDSINIEKFSFLFLSLILLPFQDVTTTTSLVFLLDHFSTYFISYMCMYVFYFVYK